MKHILMLFSDQQRQDTIGAYGNDVMQTPNLDALANDSIIFQNCITPSPVCVPARFSMLSGQYPARTGCNNNNSEAVYKEPGFYNRMTERGYESCCIGKMHYELDLYGSMGFKKRITQEEFADSNDDYTQFILKNYPHVYDYHGMRSEMYYVPQISQLPTEAHPTNWIGDRSVEYIEEFDSQQSMFLVSSFIHPHPPFSPPAPWNKLYREDPPVPYNTTPEERKGFAEILGNRCACERLQMSDQDILRMKNYYYSCVSFVDYQVGRIIQALKDKGMYEDTLILYSSDHGDMMGDLGMVGKRIMMDGACRIPFILHYPGKKPGVRDDVCSLVDVAPTLLRYAGIEYQPNEFDGIDLFGEEIHEYVFSQFGCGSNGDYMVTDGKEKLIYHDETGHYFYFESMPEMRNTYDLSNPRVQYWKKLLDAYRASDANTAEKSITQEGATRSFPHYMGRMDHAMRQKEEAAEIPTNYCIDLG